MLKLLAKEFCLTELQKHELSEDNVQEILIGIISDVMERFKTCSLVEKKVIKCVMGRLGHYLHESWDREKEEGVLRNKKTSFRMVSYFIKTNTYGK